MNTDTTNLEDIKLPARKTGRKKNLIIKAPSVMSIPKVLSELEAGILLSFLSYFSESAPKPVYYTFNTDDYSHLFISDRKKYKTSLDIIKAFQDVLFRTIEIEELNTKTTSIAFVAAESMEYSTESNIFTIRPSNALINFWDKFHSLTPITTEYSEID